MNIENVPLVFKVPLALYGSLLILILVHEIGHLLVGLVAGFQLISIRVGIIEFRRSFGWKLDWRWMAAFSGLVSMCAGKRSQSGLGVRYFVFILAGPLANVGFLFLVIPFSQRGTAFAVVANLIMIGSVFLVVVNLIPGEHRGIETDGKKLWALLFSKSRRAEMYFLLTLSESLEGVRQLCTTGAFQDALQRVGALIQVSETLPKVHRNVVVRRILGDFQSAIQKAVVSPPQSEHPMGSLDSFQIESVLP
jgi:hypothetical protein